MREWVKVVESDPEIPTSDRLTFSALEDHFPEMLQELAGEIRSGPLTSDSASVKATAKAHAKSRWKNGYRLDEVLRELNRIREMLTHEIRDHLSDLPAAESEPIVRQAEQFFGLVISTSAVQFSVAQDAELILRKRQLEHAYEQVHAATEEIRDLAESRLRLLRAVTHELRNSVQPVVLGATLVKELPDWDNEAGTALVNSAAKLQSLLSKLSELSSLLSGEAKVVWQRFSVPDLVRQIQSDHAVEAKRKGLLLDMQVPSQISEQTSDPEKVRKIANELVGNAIKFTDAGFVRLEVAENANGWTLKVVDSGPGLEPDMARQVFGEFHTPPTLPNVGARLGLVASRHLARLIGGDLTFSTTLHKGSTFQLHLLREVPPL